MRANIPGESGASTISPSLTFPSPSFTLLFHPVADG